MKGLWMYFLYIDEMEHVLRHYLEWVWYRIRFEQCSPKSSVNAGGGGLVAAPLAVYRKMANIWPGLSARKDFLNDWRTG